MINVNDIKMHDKFRTHDPSTKNTNPDEHKSERTWYVVKISSFINGNVVQIIKMRYGRIQWGPMVTDDKKQLPSITQIYY